ncbi:tripartite tricarboxylate transporter permease [Paracoccus aerodenitrificans]|uniref:tripartite tricarboxylate transporter permease n=1 Tax=Paracoccus aerodenitrificans TaxID=3017781 RepID=UPI0022F13A71|nr:tripartite tricarboxylate transporter permease [Paracoccus aerodenitrificans]WBU64135.1 tripartite tricarboxylate transporter permease [Paracoccus aerodenitrificans]
MEAINSLMQGFGVVFDPLNLALVLFGCFAGTLIGALPGLGPINGVAILLPIAYSLQLPPESALILLAGIYYGAEYGGRISSILLNVPGDAGAIMTTLDGNPMAKKGEAGRALALSAVASFVGGTIAVILLTLFAPALSRFGVTFGPAEYVALMVFAFSALASLVGRNAVKTLIGAVLGLMIATIGIDANTGVERYVFGVHDILAGIDFLIIVIGLFGIGELLHLIEAQMTGKLEILPVGKSFVTWKDLMLTKWAMLRSSLIGFIIGVLPGTGASVASAVTYGTEKRIAGREGATFGTGNPKGLVAPEAANNASAGGAMVPMLTLGIPGSGTTAILLGALLMFNIQPGPLMFQQRPEIAWGLIASMYVGNVALLIINLPLVGLFARILTLPQSYLIPLIALLSFVGVYSVVGNAFDLYLVIGFGVLGWLLRKFDFSLAPVILGVVLGALFENNLRRALSVSGGDWSILIASGKAIFLYVLAAAALFLPSIMSRVAARRSGTAGTDPTED